MHNLEEQSSPRCMTVRRYQALMQAFVGKLEPLPVDLDTLLNGWGCGREAGRRSGTEVKANNLLH